jgi:hypothetical protein
MTSDLGRFDTVHQTGKLFRKYKQAATGATAVNGYRATGLFLCDMDIFRQNYLPLASGNTDTGPVNFLALVRTSDQPSFSSYNFLPFTSAEALRSSDISPVPSLNYI